MIACIQLIRRKEKMKLIKIEGFGSTYYINPAHIVSVHVSSVKTTSREYPFALDDVDFIPCVAIQTINETYSSDETLESVLAKIEEVDK
jgi:hypothetical protein